MNFDEVRKYFREPRSIDFRNCYRIRPKEFISFLESRGLINIHNITFNKLTTKVLIVEDKKFFSANVTCLAIMARYGIKPISVNEFKTRLKNQTEMINNL